MSENVAARFADLPRYLSSHLALSVAALALAIAFSVPVGVWLARTPRLRGSALAIAGAAQTIPSLALLALMVPFFVWIKGSGLFGWINSLWISRTLGLEIAPLGFFPALAALTLYGVLPILRNTVTGILGVDAEVTEAACAVGMTSRERLRFVEFPLAAPVIVTGIRTATVWVVGTATLATPVGQRCLGNYIFPGLQLSNWTMVMFGVIGAATLAVGLDTGIGAIEGALRARRPRRALALAGVLVGMVLVGLLLPTLASLGSGKGETPLRIGAKTFTEQYLLANLIERSLAGAGIDSERVEGLGSTIVFDALAAGEIDVYVDYTGTIWANGMKRSGGGAPSRVLAEVSWWLESEHKIRCLGSLGFENAYALAVRRSDAERLGLRTIADLAKHAKEMRIGGDYEFFGRPEWESLVAAYRLPFADRLSYDPTLLYSAISSEQVDVISAFSSDGRIASNDLVVLADPAHALPPYDAILLVGPSVAERPDVIAALLPLVGAIELRTMQEANGWVDRKEEPWSVERAGAELRRRIRGE